MAEGIGILIRPWVRKYVAGVALNGVPIRYPQISPATNRWMLFNPITNVYEDSGVVARGASPYIDITTGTWLLWNEIVGDYVDSGVAATGPQGEAPQFRTVGRLLQYRFATQTPTAWTDLYEFPPAPSYTHTQTTPAAVWNIQHNLGGTPVTILAVGTDGEQIVGQVDAPASTNNLLVYRFNEPIAGTAHIKF
jgi:hypothetical protein